MKNRLPRSGTVIYHYLTSRQMTGSIDVHSNSHCGGKEETKENNHRRMDRVVPGFEPHLPVANSDSSERTRYAGAVFSSLETVGKEYHNQRRLAEKKHDFIARTVRDEPPSRRKAMSSSDLSKGFHYFNGCPSKEFPFALPDDAQSTVHPVDRFHIYNTSYGCQVKRTDKKNTFVFRLLPREWLLSEGSGWDPHKYYEVLMRYDQEEKNKKPTVRNNKAKSRRALYENGSVPMYHCPGTKVRWDGQGINDEKPANISAATWNDFVDMMVTIESIATKYIEQELQWGVKEARKEVPWPSVKKAKDDADVGNNEDINNTPSDADQCGSNSNKRSQQQPALWQQAAFARNCVLNAHKDDDFFWSCTSVFWAKEEYTMNDPRVQYFVFPEDGVAVALRPGDILLFNPTVNHCISSRRYFGSEVIVCSLYLKSKLVGGNRNIMKGQKKRKGKSDEEEIGKQQTVRKRNK